MKRIIRWPSAGCVMALGSAMVWLPNMAEAAAQSPDATRSLAAGAQAFAAGGVAGRHHTPQTTDVTWGHREYSAPRHYRYHRHPKGHGYRGHAPRRYYYDGYGGHHPRYSHNRRYWRDGHRYPGHGVHGYEGRGYKGKAYRH